MKGREEPLSLQGTIQLGIDYAKYANLYNQRINYCIYYLLIPFAIFCIHFFVLQQVGEEIEAAVAPPPWRPEVEYHCEAVAMDVPQPDLSGFTSSPDVVVPDAPLSMVGAFSVEPAQAEPAMQPVMSGIAPPAGIGGIAPPAGATQYCRKQCQESVKVKQQC